MADVAVVRDRLSEASAIVLARDVRLSADGALVAAACNVTVTMWLTAGDGNPT